MIPDIDVLTENLDEIEYPSKTYGIEFVKDGDDCIQGYIDEVEAIKQAALLIVNTERYEFPIYSWDYGIELYDLVGQPMPYVMSEVERRVEEALTQDDRIESVKDFEFTVNKSKLHVKFTIVTNIADIPSDLEVDI